MTTNTAPLTRNAHGSTRCVSCSKKFADTPDMPVTESEATEQGWSGIDSAGQFRRSLTPHTVTRKWHTSCLAELEAANQRYRDQVAADRIEMARSIAVGAVTSGQNTQEDMIDAATKAGIDPTVARSWFTDTDS